MPPESPITLPCLLAFSARHYLVLKGGGIGRGSGRSGGCGGIGRGSGRSSGCGGRSGAGAGRSVSSALSPSGISPALRCTWCTCSGGGEKSLCHHSRHCCLWGGSRSRRLWPLPRRHGWANCSSKDCRGLAICWQKCRSQICCQPVTRQASGSPLTLTSRPPGRSMVTTTGAPAGP